MHCSFKYYKQSNDIFILDPILHDSLLNYFKTNPIHFINKFGDSYCSTVVKGSMVEYDFSLKSAFSYVYKNLKKSIDAKANISEHSLSYNKEQIEDSIRKSKHTSDSTNLKTFGVTIKNFTFGRNPFISGNFEEVPELPIIEINVQPLEKLLISDSTNLKYFDLIRERQRKYILAYDFFLNLSQVYLNRYAEVLSTQNCYSSEIFLKIKAKSRDLEKLVKNDLPKLRKACETNVLNCKCDIWTKIDLSLPPPFDFSPCNENIKEVTDFIQKIRLNQNQESRLKERYDFLSGYKNSSNFDELVSIDSSCLFTVYPNYDRTLAASAFDIIEFNSKAIEKDITIKSWNYIKKHGKDIANDRKLIEGTFSQLIYRIEKVKKYYPTLKIVNAPKYNNSNEYILKPGQELKLSMSWKYPEIYFKNNWIVNRFVGHHYDLLIPNESDFIPKSKIFIKVRTIK